jgi:hypothetical protein
MQALTLAISLTGLRYLVQYYLGGSMESVLSTGLVPPDTTVPVQDIVVDPTKAGSTRYTNIRVSLSGGSLENFKPIFQSLTQGDNSRFTITLVASGMSVHYTWSEHYEIWEGPHDSGPGGGTWPYSMSVGSFTITVPFSLTQQARSYTLTVGKVSATPTGMQPNIPGKSIVQEQPGPCFTQAVDGTTVQALENIDFSTAVQNLLQNLFGTIPASGQLTPDIVFNFTEGDSPLAFSGNEGLTVGVTGNTTWKGEAYAGGTPPSLAIPSVPATNHVHLFASDYQFNELYWAFYKDGRLDTTIIGGQLPDPGMLNTKYYQNGALAPLYRKYPNLPMTVGVAPQTAPTVTFQTAYQLSFGDNGVLTTQEMALPPNVYQELESIQGTVYLSAEAYSSALQTALGPDAAQYTQQIIQASVVAGPFSQVYQVTAAGLSSLQSQLPSGVYQQLSGALTAGQVFVDKAWLLVTVENAVGTLPLANQYAPVIEAAFAVSGSCNQVYWVTPGTNGALTTLVDQIPADVYNDLTGLANVVYLDQASFSSDVQNAIGADAGQYSAQIQRLAQVNGAIATHDVLAVFNVIRAGQTIPCFTVHFKETDFQQNFHLGNAGYNQTVKFDFQLINSETSASLVSSNIPGINASDFPTIWNYILQPVYALEMQKMAHTGVPLPFMAGLKFLFDQATVAIQPGYADIHADIEYFASAAFAGALSRDPATVDVPALMAQLPDQAGPSPSPEPARTTAAGGRPALHLTRSAASRTRLVRLARQAGPVARGAGRDALASDTLDFHFALGHLPGAGPFHLNTGSERIALQPHTPDTLAAYASRNDALGLLDDESRSMFTHYAEAVELPADRVRILRVPYPSATAPIPELALLAVHVPVWARQATRERRLRRNAQGVPPGLARLGVTTRLPFAQALAAANDADQLITTQSTAATLVAMHPQLASADPVVKATILDGHVNSPDNLANVQRFAGAISRQGANWQAATAATDIHGNQLVWGPSFSRAGQPVYRNRLSDATVAGAAGALRLPLTTSQQDPALQNSSWSVNQGIGSVSHVAPQAAQGLRAGRARAKAAMAANGGYAFTLNNLTPGPGLSIDDTSLDFTSDPKTPGAGTLTIEVTNNFLRSLYAYAQFLDDSGRVIQVPVDQPDDGQADGGQQLADYLPVGVVTPVNVVLGFPAPTEPTALRIGWPVGAASARLVHGGLGTSRWDNDIVWPGAVLTGIFNYAIPGLFLVAGAELDSNAWFKTLEEDKPLVAKLLSLGLGIFGAETSASIGFPDVTGILSAMADAIAGFLVHVGLEKLQAYMVEKLGEEALEDSIPAVDIFFQIANRAVDLAELAETTIEVLTCPAVYEVDIVRTMDLQVVVSPDPTHGTTSDPAIWPQVAATWEAIVQYQDGTPHAQTGSMTGLGTSSQPVTATFTALPAGGSLQVKFNVYSATGFLCGQFTSAWQSAGVPAGQQALTVTGSIQENLVPLTASTLYQYKQKLVYDEATSAHMWQPGQFTLDASQGASLDNRQISPAISAAFEQNGFTLGYGATVDVLNAGSAWTITAGVAVYRIVVQQQMSGDKMITVLTVNTGNIPLQVVTSLDADDTGHNLAKLVNITMNDKAYMLGYCWRASGQSIPETGQAFPLSTQIHAFQNINVLADPQVSLKFSPSGFVNQPAIVYDRFGPAPLFSVPATFSAGLDGGAIQSDLAALFKAFAYPLADSAVVTVVTPGAAWTIGLPHVTPAYSLARVTDVIEVHPYPTEAISQRNYYVQPTSDSPSAYQYQLRPVALDNITSFDMNQTHSWGMFTLPFNDDFVVHPQGYVVAISYTQSRMMILKLPDQPAPDNEAISAVITSGPAGAHGRPGLMNGPVALSVATDGRILVLEQGTPDCPARIQAFDVNGNPVPSFDGQPITTVPVTLGADLNAGLVSTRLRQAFAAAGMLLSGVWLIRGGTTLYQLTQDASTVTVTSGGADLSLNWTIKSGPSIYELSLGGQAISVAEDGKTLFPLPASLAGNLDSGITTGDVAAAFSQHNITLTAPVSVTGDKLTLAPSVVADLAEGTVPAPLAQALAERGLPLPANATVSASVTVTVREAGQLWTLQDLRASTSYKISCHPAGDVLDIVEFPATMPLHDPPGQAVTYLSMSTELKGYIYVLSYVGDGSSASDYRLDIYLPNGPWLARTTGLNAAKIVVDMWRNLYTLNYESFAGPGGRTEPSVSTWIPST